MMKKYLQLFLMSAVGGMSAFATEAERGFMHLPSFPSKILHLDDPEGYPDDCRRKANEAYEILQIMEEPDEDTLRKGVMLLIETAQAGDSCSLEKLANMALFGQHSIPKDVGWAVDALIYLTDKGEGGAWNFLNAIDINAVKLLEVGKREEARQLFIKTWSERE